MEKNTLVVALCVLPVMALASFSSAFASTTNCEDFDMQAVHEAMDAQKNGETLTSSQEELLESAESCKPEMDDSQRPEKSGSGRLMGSGAMMRPDHGSGAEMKNPPSFSGSEMQDKINQKKGSNINAQYKTLIDTRVDKILENVEDLSSEEKFEHLQNFVTKIEKAQSVINASDTYTTTQKNLYDGILSYLLESLETKITEKSETEDDFESIIEGLFQ